MSDPIKKSNEVSAEANKALREAAQQRRLQQQEDPAGTVDQFACIHLLSCSGEHHSRTPFPFGRRDGGQSRYSGFRTGSVRNVR